MAVEIVHIVGGNFQQPAVVEVATAGCRTGVGEVGIDAVIVRETAVVALFHRSECVDFQAFHRLDVHRGLDAAAEVVAIAVGFLPVHIFYRIHRTCLSREIVSVGSACVVDGISRVEQRGVLEISAEIVVAVVHVRKVVLEIEPAVEGFLPGGDLGDHLVAVGVAGYAFGVLVVDGSAIVELA